MPPEDRTSLPLPLREGAKHALRGYARVSAPLRPLPDFLIIGTKRGGTTSLWNWLLQHPDVLPPFPARQRIKSSHYFFRHYDRGESWYRSFFPTAAARRAAARSRPGRVVTGEASPYYLFDPRVAARVAHDLPRVRVIVLLRDPVARAASHHRERTNAGVEGLSLAAALAAEPGRLAGEEERMWAEPAYYSRAHDWYSYRSRGVYAPQLEQWRALVAPERLLVLPSEEMYADPRATFRTVERFLGLEPFGGLQARHYNFRPGAIDPAVRADLEAFYAPHNERLFSLLGRRLDWPGA